MDSNVLGIIFGIICIVGFIYTIFDNAVAKTERDGRIKKMDKESLRADAKITDVKTTTVGTKTNKEFRITVIFDDGFQYVKVVKPANTSVRFTTYTFTLSREQKVDVVNEAIREHNNALGIKGTQAGNGGNAALDAFSQRLFPEGEASKEHIKKQMQILMGEIPNEENYLKTYIYCMTHYLVNGQAFDYVADMLPIAHPEIKDSETAKKVAAYTLICATGSFNKLNLSLDSDLEIYNQFLQTYKERSEIIKSNADKNKGEYDEEVGLIKNKPMYFNGVKNAESYLNSLKDENGNKLHIGTRYSYNVEGIPDMLDCYSMLDENETKVGELFVSIYGQDNYRFVPKGYRGKEDNKQKEKEKKETVSNKKIETEEKEEVLKDGIKKDSEKDTTQKKKKYDANAASLAMNDILGKTSSEEKEVPLNKPIEKNHSEPKQKESIIKEEPKQILFCRKCGTKLDPDSVFCKKCGTRVGG